MKSYIIPIIGIISFFGLLFSCNAAEQEVTGLFSTFRLSESSGDIVGAEIHIVPNPKGYSAIVQGSEGAPGFPEVVTVLVREDTITFQIPVSSASGLPPGKYIGCITSEGLQLDGPTETLKRYRMPRKKSYWQ